MRFFFEMRRLSRMAGADDTGFNPRRRQMRTRLLTLAVILAAVPVPALADFRIVTAPQPGDTPIPAAPVQKPAGIVSEQLPPPEPEPPRFAKAVGFGNSVPLSFALRQIVPHGIKIIYGKGVDSEALTSWQGGAPWDAVLRHAVAPLGLHVHLQGATALIKY
jgi:hypothetical protein